MPGVTDNLRRWREAAEVDWFSQFIKAWIPFNAWMTNIYGDLPDRDLLDKVKTRGNIVFNRTLPMISQRLKAARDMDAGWQDDGADAKDFRLQIGELHSRLQECVVEGRRGRVSFETVDIGNNPKKDEQETKWKRLFHVRRDYPNKLEVTLEISATKTHAAFLLTLPSHNLKELEDAAAFQELRPEQRMTLTALFHRVAPRRVINVLAEHGARDHLTYGNVHFVSDAEKNFSALVDILYNLRNALFHGSITPNDIHNKIYKPAYLITMHLVQFTI